MTTTEAHILMFDRDSSQGWGANENNDIIEHNGVKIDIWKLNKGW